MLVLSRVRIYSMPASPQVDFPFKVSPAEQDIITMQPNSSLILLGRSGTGKVSDL